MRAEYFHRAEGERTATAGRYSMGGRDLLIAWGFADEEHCRHHAVRDGVGGWQAAVDGCPDVEVVRDDRNQAVVGLSVRDVSGDWVRA